MVLDSDSSVVSNLVDAVVVVVTHRRFVRLEIHGYCRRRDGVAYGMSADLLVELAVLNADLLRRFRPIVDGREVSAIEVRCYLVMNP